MSEAQINDVALNLEYVKKHTKNYSAEQAYLLQQCTVWRRLSVHLGWGYKNTHVAYDEIPKSEQNELYANAKTFAKENKNRYDCGGYIYTGEGQDLGQFWANLAVGKGNLQKILIKAVRSLTLLSRQTETAIQIPLNYELEHIM